MAKFKTLMVPSTTEGLHWSVSCYKPERGGVTLSAIEGKLTKSDAGNGLVYSSFEYQLYGDTRSYREIDDGKMTAKNIAKAVTRWLAKMYGAGLIAEADYKVAVEKVPGNITTGKR